MNINFFQILFQVVNFTILIFLLRKYLYRPILKILEQRAKKIHDGLEAAEKSIEEREKIEKQKKKVLVEAEKNANQILEGARIRAQKLEKDLAEKAHIQEQKRAKRAQEQAQAQRRQMEKDLQRKFTETVINTTEALLNDSLGPKEQKAILDRQIQQLKKTKIT
ncbi:F0F1 ATP synthase subunit B [Patescibacteria group bacterium]|nr:F0F1 ATP synthase subunit B [Patescibacteria group bacterium]